ncbi:MAG: hypothetical protein HQK53_16970, partial [Oligoflexia bacterium]|nr:hypothetical protein [Oligoflexia bacterium]
IIKKNVRSKIPQSKPESISITTMHPKYLENIGHSRGIKEIPREDSISKLSGPNREHKFFENRMIKILPT